MVSVGWPSAASQRGINMTTEQAINLYAKCANRLACPFLDDEAKEYYKMVLDRLLAKVKEENLLHDGKVL